MSARDERAGRAGAHLDDAALQALADGSLRGPEGMTAREHCESCALCEGERAAYAALDARLSGLAVPPLPADFTAGVLAAAAGREQHLVARRQHALAAIPAAALALLSILGWAFSAGPGQRVNEIVAGALAVREAADLAGPLVNALRLPLALGALVLCACVAAALVRALRPPARASEA